jgi:crotonobetainyl-CoA:carnitine CoA-transferase CaiB-like acyl-CoA transferase
MRLKQMGAHCTKLEPQSPIAGTSADPMALYQPQAYEVMHEGVHVVQADLKTPAGQKKLHQLLAKTDLLITSFRPSALKKLGMSWKRLHAQCPQLCMISIVGASGARAEEPGHDLTYLAENHLITGLDLPATLYADMGGSLLTTEAALNALLVRSQRQKGVFQEIALSDAAAYLALPRTWQLTAPKGDVGGAHAGYNVYACKNGRVAVAALEPHFAKRLCEAAGLPSQAFEHMKKAATHKAIAAFLQTQTRAQLDRLASQKDIPLHTLPR